MANVTNTFVKSKMNKDLDDRLLSNGEYRDAQNVNISRSEGEDVGALENVLGNKSISTLQGNGGEVIGYYKDDTTQCVYSFLTNFTDPSSDQLSTFAPYGSECFILKTHLSGALNGTTVKLVVGRFLNFSKTHHIYGVNLIEDLLFWTDDRNQPRKINIKLADSINSGSPSFDPSYYTDEDQISVAKYYPHSTPFLYESITINIVSQQGGGGFFIYKALTADVAKLRNGDVLNVPYVKIPITASNPNGSNKIEYPVQIQQIDYDSDTDGNSSFLTQLPADPNIGGQNIEFLRPSSKRVSDEYLPENNSARFVSKGGSGTAADPYFIVVKSLLSQNNPIVPNSKIIGPSNNPPLLVTASQTSPGAFPYVSSQIQTGTVEAEGLTDGISYLSFQEPNPTYVDSWPGDKDYLRDKFVRFAYRFKFDDGEYSLISPFTQPAFIPKQDGYITSTVTRGAVDTSISSKIATDTESIQQSTIVQFFENKVQDVIVKIKMPFVVNQLNIKLKVDEIEILYKESDGKAIKVLETIEVTSSQITSNSTTILEYKYQSRSPIKALPEKEVFRVFDKVPVRARSQSISGNRVIYGNFLDKHTPPENLDYNVAVSDKYRPNASNTTYSTISYPNHSLKQNRSYQVGIVLSDRFGRQSDVILSSITDFQFEQAGGSEVFEGSTIFSPYKQDSASWSDPYINTTTVGSTAQGIQNGDTANPITWFGNSLKVLFRNKIPETVTYASGYPGLYCSGIFSPIAYSADEAPTARIVGRVDPRISIGDFWVGQLPSNLGDYASLISIGTYDAATNSTILTFDGNNGDVATYVGEPFIIYGKANLLGWYSYKIVVQQLKQEYYNAYLPLIVNDVPGKIDAASLSQAYTTLISDNVNKIPSDLQEVQPEQTQFRTSDAILYPRVITSNWALSGQFGDPGGTQSPVYIQRTASFQSNLGDRYFTVDTIGKVTDLGVNTNNITTTPVTAAPGIYDAKSNPTVARLSTYNNLAGYSSVVTRNNVPNSPDPSPPGGIVPDLSSAISILEIDPTPSNIQIYWETSTTGLVSDLNAFVDNGPAATVITPSPPTNTVVPITR